jgi:UDP-glucose 4-epimerase
VADDLSSGSEENLAGSAEDVRFLEGDLRDPKFAEQAATDNEMVFHLAAAHGGRGYIDTHPVECVNNMALDHSVYQAAARTGVSKIVFASSACVYPTSLQDSSENRALLRESDAGFDAPGKAFADGEYGWAKLMGELQLHAFHKQYGLEGIACRIFTAYGERENESHAVIALIAKAFARRNPYPIWGNGLQTRNFTYVGDTVAGLCLAGAKLSGYDVINVGGSQHITIGQLTDEIFSILNWRPAQIAYELDKPVGVRSRAADVDKCLRVMGWSPSFSIREGLERTIGWYRHVRDERRVRSLDSLLMTR